MNHRLQVVKGRRGIANMRVLGIKHLRVCPTTELVFNGAFYCPDKVFIKAENLCKRNVAFRMETSSPDRFLITPATGILEPESFLTIEILMYPNAANEDIEMHEFALYYVVALGKVNQSSITKEWMELQPHDTAQENWSCRFKQPPKNRLHRDLFLDCQSLPVAPVIPRAESICSERIKMIKKLRQDNAKLREEVHWLKVRTLMEAKKARDPRSNHIRLSDILDASIEDLVMICGINVHNMRFLNVRVIVVLLQVVILFGGIIFGRYFF